MPEEPEIETEKLREAVGTMAPVGCDWPRITWRWMASMSIAWYRALRTRRSLSGFFPFTFEYRS